MIKSVTLSNIASITFILLSLLSAALANEVLYVIIVLFCIIAYCVLNITMLIITETKKQNIEPQEYKYSMISYIFNLIYPIIAIIILICLIE